MSKKLSILAVFATVAFVLIFGAGVVQAEETFTGEVIDKACFERQGAHGPDHADCAKRCFEDGGDVGLLTADGEVILLKAGEDEEVFDAVKALAGAQANVTGEVSEEEGMKVVVVTATEPVTT